MDWQAKNPPLRWQATWVVGCRFVGILATFASNILAARLLGPAEFGVFLFLASVATAGGLIGTARLNNTMLRFCSESLALGHRQSAVAKVRRTAGLSVVTTVLAAGLTVGGLVAFHFATGRLSNLTLLNKTTPGAERVYAAWLALPALKR